MKFKININCEESQYNMILKKICEIDCKTNKIKSENILKTVTVGKSIYINSG